MHSVGGNDIYICVAGEGGRMAAQVLQHLTVEKQSSPSILGMNVTVA